MFIVARLKAFLKVLLIEFYPVKMPGACYDLMRKVAETGGGEANVLKLEPKHFCVFICSEVKFISCVSGRFVGGLLLVSPGFPSELLSGRLCLANVEMSCSKQVRDDVWESLENSFFSLSQA